MAKPLPMEFISTFQRIFWEKNSKEGKTMKSANPSRHKKLSPKTNKLKNLNKKFSKVI
jgi:hypothetical protein